MTPDKKPKTVRATPKNAPFNPSLPPGTEGMAICVKCGHPVGRAIAAWIGEPPKHPTGMCPPTPRINAPEGA